MEVDCRWDQGAAGDDGGRQNPGSEMSECECTRHVILSPEGAAKVPRTIPIISLIKAPPICHRESGIHSRSLM